MSDFTARLAQLELAKLDNEALVARFTDASIALAIRREVTPQQVHREALASFAWPESEWPTVRENILGWLRAAAGLGEAQEGKQ